MVSWNAADLLPPNACATERKLAQAVTPHPEFFTLANAPRCIRYRLPLSLQSTLAAEWRLAEFAPFFDSTEALIQAGLPWLKMRGTAAAVKTAIAWANIRVEIEEDGAYLHISTTDPLTPADLSKIQLLAKASIPAHIALYRIHNEYDLRAGRYDVGRYDDCIYDADSGIWVTTDDGDEILVSYGETIKVWVPPEEITVYSVLSETHSAEATMLHSPTWDLSYWDDTDFPVPHSIITHSHSVHIATRPDQVNDLSSFIQHGMAQAVYDQTRYDDAHTRYDKQFITEIKNPARFDESVYDDHDLQITTTPVNMITTQITGICTEEPEITAFMAMTSLMEPAAATLEQPSWTGNWDERCWREPIYIKITHEEAPITTFYWQMPLPAISVAAGGLAAQMPQFLSDQQGWDGSWDARTWDKPIFIHMTTEMTEET